MAKSATTELTVRENHLEKMTEQTRIVVTQFEQKLRTKSVDIIKTYYECGEKLKKMKDEPQKYGEDYAKHVEGYLGLPVHEMIRMAEVFEKDWLLEQAAIPNANGVILSPLHFCQLAQLSASSDRVRVLKQIREESLSIRNVKMLVLEKAMAKKNKRSGGRKPGKPQSAAGIAIALRKKAQTMENFLNAVDEFFDEEEEIEEADVSDKLIGLTEEALVELRSLGGDIQERTEVMERKLVKLKEIRASAAPDEASDDEEEAPEAGAEADDEEEETEAAAPGGDEDDEDEEYGPPGDEADDEDEEAPAPPKKAKAKKAGKKKGKKGGKKRARQPVGAED